jgi:peptidase E
MKKVTGYNKVVTHLPNVPCNATVVYTVSVAKTLEAVTCRICKKKIFKADRETIQKFCKQMEEL